MTFYHGAFLFGLTKGWDIPYIAHFSNSLFRNKNRGHRWKGRNTLPMKPPLSLWETGEIDDREIKERVEHYRRGGAFSISEPG